MNKWRDLTNRTWGSLKNTTWREVKLEEIAPFKYGKSKVAKERITGKYDVYSSGGHCGYSDDMLANKGIIIGRKGSVGTVYYSDKPFFAIDTAFFIDSVDKQSDLKFIYYLLTTLKLEEYNNDAAVPGLNRNLAHKLKLQIPDLETQEKIADILSTYDKLIENNNRRIKILEEIAEEIYKEWFVRMRFPGHKNTTFEKGIPKGWEVVKVRDLAKKIESGKRPKANYSEEHMVVSLGAADIKSLGEYEDSKEYLIPYSFFKEMRRGKVEDKDIAIYKDGAYTGKTTMFRDGFPYSNIAVNEHVFLVQCKDPKLQNYLLFTLKQKSYFDLIQALSMTSAQPGLNQNKLKNIKIQIPTNDLVEKFHILTESLLKQIFNLAKQNQNLKKQRDLLLPRLMNGTIQVK